MIFLTWTMAWTIAGMCWVALSLIFEYDIPPVTSNDHTPEMTWLMIFTLTFCVAVMAMLMVAQCAI